MRSRSVFALGALYVMLLLSNQHAAAQEITLRAISSFAEGSVYSAPFERFIEKVNNEGKGVLQINYIGGPRAMPPFEVGNAVRAKVVDIANVAAAYYTNLMPEADAVKLLNKPAAEQRRNGTWDLLSDVHRQKLNAHYLARQFVSVPYHIYLNKKIDKLSFDNLKIRVTPVYRDLVQAFGGTPVTTPPGETYTALERNVVDGYGWPILGIFDLGLERVTKFRIDPGFYSVDVGVLVNNDVWRGLNDAQRKVLIDAALWLESLDDTENAEKVKAERESQAKAGVQILTFSPVASEEFVKKANSLAWDAIVARVPEFGKKLRALNGG